ncbi:hypothetical protein [Gordonia alkaliphila]|uniref:Uncharacterized protein n=1 Tax=Gordonia alkaliphila TaxID=1053547 RepID=A0ABP8YZ50_9ACTN
MSAPPTARTTQELAREALRTVGIDVAGESIDSERLVSFLPWKESA